MTNTVVGYCYSCLVVISRMKIQSLKKSTQVSQLKFSTQSLRTTAVSVKLNSLPLNVPAHITHNDKHHQKVHDKRCVGSCETSFGYWAEQYNLSKLRLA